MTFNGRISVSTVVPVVGLTRVYPVAEVAYILLAVSAYLDTTGRFKYTTDVFSVADSASLNTSKTADADAFAVSDSSVLDTGKGLSDSATMGDTVITVLIFIRNFSDTTTPADAKTLLISPAYSDSISEADLLAISFSGAYTDSATLVDNLATSFSTAFADSFGQSDAIQLSPALGKTDSFSLTEAGVILIQDYSDPTYFLTDYVGASYTF